MTDSEAFLSERAHIAAALISAFPQRYMPPNKRFAFRDIGRDVQAVIDRITPKEHTDDQ